ncbi:protein HGH1 homolog isoform X2 [Nilaparvata lugens]|uniref:protein HGH1 homolog isoform X2 n=1 Tax=Nilaparvata lugens TaxID=108931 RepID=UPI00193EB31A|nr:protein HGH1 homolog isoform X2 [Nilaparvata lugens]
MEKKTPIEELALLFSKGNDELKLEACNEILSLSGTEAMIDEFLKVYHIINPELVRLMRLKNDLSLKAGSVLVNLSSHTVGSRSLVGVECASHYQCPNDSMSHVRSSHSVGSRSLVECASHHPCLRDSVRSSLVQCCVENICDCNSKLADVCCMILSNISRDPSCLEVLKGEFNGEILEKFMKVLFEENFNKSGCNLDYLAHFLANFAQDTVLRSYIIGQGKKFKKYFLETLHSVELLGLENKCRKQGLLALYRNLSLSKDSHGLFLDGPVVQLFTSALFALVNSIKYDNANHIEECKKSMDPELCILVLDTLLIFCATKRGRIILRESDVYIALKEVHSTSSDKAIEIATEKIVDILIRTEDEIGVNDYLDLEIPEHLVQKFRKYDLEDAEEIEGSKIKLK